MIVQGNVHTQRVGVQGWFVGGFAPVHDPHHTYSVEVQYITHKKGDRRTEWSQNRAQTLTLLIGGKVRLQFRDQDVLLDREGDYCLFSGIEHAWQAEEFSTVVTVRWPSGAG